MKNKPPEKNENMGSLLQFPVKKTQEKKVFPPLKLFAAKISTKTEIEEHMHKLVEESFKVLYPNATFQEQHQEAYITKILKNLILSIETGDFCLIVEENATPQVVIIEGQIFLSPKSKLGLHLRYDLSEAALEKVNVLQSFTPGSGETMATNPQLIKKVIATFQATSGNTWFKNNYIWGF